MRDVQCSIAHGGFVWDRINHLTYAVLVKHLRKCVRELGSRVSMYVDECLRLEKEHIKQVCHLGGMMQQPCCESSFQLRDKLGLSNRYRTIATSRGKQSSFCVDCCECLAAGDGAACQ
jgi:hypothetical protein